MTDSQPVHPAFPHLATWTGGQLEQLAMPIGGIGTGTVSLGGRGDLCDWEVMNRPAKGYVPKTQGHPGCFLWWQGADTTTAARLLEGPLGTQGFMASEGADIPNSQFPRFREATMHTTYPFAEVELKDPDVPLLVALQAGNPLLPGDVNASSWPLADLRWQVTNTTSETMDVSICVNIPNFIGMDGSQREADWRGYWLPVGAQSNRNIYRTQGNCAGLLMTSEGVDPADPAWGSMALVTTATGAQLSYCTAWHPGRWNRPLLDWWQDWTADGQLSPCDARVDAPMASLSIRQRIAAGSTAVFPFMICWHFPNRQDWDDEDLVGNHYTQRFADAWAVAEQAAERLPADLERSRRFIADVTAGDCPTPFVEAALANASTLRSQTCFQTSSGLLAGWEGIHDRKGSCAGSCTHVWNYEHLTWQLYPELARGMREAEFHYGTDSEGRMAFRLWLPEERNHERTPDLRLAAADGQLGCIVKAWREWRQSGDHNWLAPIYPAVRRCMEFCWIPGGWDADGDGLMEGCQHNTMDVEYLGPNPQMQAWYVAALDAMADMAAAMQEDDFATRCWRLSAAGALAMDAQLFEDGWYRHRIQPLAADAIAPGLRAGMADMDPLQPELQLGDGCLIDQLVGTVVGQLAGLAPRLDRHHIAEATRSIITHNRRETMHGHFNPMRCYAAGDEEAILMASYPAGTEPPKRPFPYFGEAMTGFEYTLALQLLQQGEAAEAERVVRAIRDRHDGQRRNPFDEIECGHHYARAMASWGLINAWSGFTWDGISGTVTVDHGHGSCAWTTAGTWGLVHRRGKEAEVEVRGADLAINAVVVRRPR